MTEETKTSANQQEETEPVEISPIEATAREQGWVSKDEWTEAGKDVEQWRPAKEFVDRGELFKSMNSTKRELQQTRATLDALKRHHTYVFEKAQKQALDELKKEKRQAIKNEDYQALEEVEERIETLTAEQAKEKAQFVQEQVTTQSQPIHPDFAAWQDDNQWYTKDEELREYADFKGIKYTQKNPGIAPKDVLEYVAREVKKQFPEKFGTKRAAPNAVLSVNKTNSKTRQVEADDDLNQTELDIERELVSSGVMTSKQYRAELKKVKERS